MNSAAGEVLAFKTCCGLKMMDQNLEILITNQGQVPITVPSHFDLIGEKGRKRISTLIPTGEQKIDPGEIKAFYCQMDEELWKNSRELVFYDTDGNHYLVNVQNR